VQRAADAHHRGGDPHLHRWPALHQCRRIRRNGSLADTPVVEAADHPDLARRRADCTWRLPVAARARAARAARAAPGRGSRGRAGGRGKAGGQGGARMRPLRPILWVPLIAFVLLAIAFGYQLVRPDDHAIRSAMVGKPVPAFALAPALPDRPGLASTD